MGAFPAEQTSPLMGGNFSKAKSKQLFSSASSETSVSYTHLRAHET